MADPNAPPPPPGDEPEDTGQAVIAAARAIQGEELAAMTEVARDVGATGGAMTYHHSDVSRTAITRGSAPRRPPATLQNALPEDFGWQFPNFNYPPASYQQFPPPTSPTFGAPYPPYLYPGAPYYPPTSQPSVAARK